MEKITTLLLGILMIAATIGKADPITMVNVDDTRTFQTMEGFGASLTDSSAWLIAHVLTPQQRQGLLQDLFDPKTGIGLSYLRQPMGSSDFRTREYTYDDLAEGEIDPPLNHFSIAKDEEYIVPLLKQIRAIDPSLHLMGTPWTAPAWMKANDHLKSDDAVYSAYADYFIRFIQAYAAQGLPIDAITLQNEPWNIQHSYPTMGMDPPEQIRLIKLLGLRLEAAGLKTKILVWDHNWDHPEYPLQVLSDADARRFVEGTAFHAYGGEVSAQSKVHDAYPDKGIYFTECSGGDWSKDFANNLIWDMANLVVGAPRNWARTVLKWNLALDEHNGPKLPGGADNCRGVVTIHQKTGEVTREEEYYALGHAAKFVRPGAKRVFSDLTESSAYLNPDRSLVLVLYNPDAQARDYRVRWHGHGFQTALPAKSVATFTWDQRPSAPVAFWLTTGDQTRLLARQNDQHMEP